MQALKCLWQLIEGNHACQQRLLEAPVPSLQGKPAPAILVSLPDIMSHTCMLRGIEHILCFVTCGLAVACDSLSSATKHLPGGSKCNSTTSPFQHLVVLVAFGLCIAESRWNVGDCDTS